LSQLGKLGSVETASALWILAPFILGAIVGLMLFTRLLSWLLDHYYAPTLAVLIGFLIGSLFVIWPYQDRTYDQHVRSTLVVEYNSQEAQMLRENPPNKNQPEYVRLGEVINPDATFDDLKQVEIETVSQKLIRSEPYIPFITSEEAKTGHFWSGVWGILIGLGMVVGLDRLQKKEGQPGKI